MELTPTRQESQEFTLLQALHVSGLPLTEILTQAESMGVSPEDQIRFARQVIPFLLEALWEDCSPRNHDLFAHMMVFGFSHPSPERLMGCLDPSVDFLELLEWASVETFTGGAPASEQFKAFVLKTAGYPLSAHFTPRPGLVADKEAMPWLDSGHRLHCGIEIARYETSALSWMTGLQILLRDGMGPESLCHAPFDPNCAYSREHNRIRLFRIRGLRDITGSLSYSVFVAVSCPDLTTLEEGPKALVLVDCPGLNSLPSLKEGCLLLHLEHCRGIRSLGCDDDPVTVHGPATLTDCPGLHQLPRHFQVEGRLTLRRMGSIHRWPDHFSVGGDLVLKDCLGMEELPPLEVGGSVRVEGKSSLCRLAAGTVVAKHLDLRACHRLEAIPRGIHVGGKIFLPSHLHRIGHFETPSPMLGEPRDLYPELRILLMGMRFPELVSPNERNTLSVRAELILEGFRTELVVNPRLETELLWIASDVWSDLAEELWEQRLQHGAFEKVTDDLPVAWFRNLLYRCQPACA